jgi:thiamine-phosphate pyrophosphorylase
MKDWVRGYYAILDLVVLDPARPPDGAAQLRGLLAEVERRAEPLLAARPCCLQLRAKSLGAAAMRDAGLWLKDRCRAAAVPFCVNDRLDVALAVGADVAHLGQDDLPLEDARRIAARRMLIGFSTHNPAQAAAAVAGGADYIGFGPIFDTRSKLRPDPAVGVEGLRAVAAASPIPVVAIGGITLGTVASVAAAGAAAAAVIAAVNDAPDPAAAGRAVAAAFTR